MQCIIPVMQPGVHSDLLVTLEVLFELAGASIRTSRSKSDIGSFLSFFEQLAGGMLAKQDYARRKSHSRHSYGVHLYNDRLSLLQPLNRALDLLPRRASGGCKNIGVTPIKECGPESVFGNSSGLRVSCVSAGGWRGIHGRCGG